MLDLPTGRVAAFVHTLTCVNRGRAPASVQSKPIWWTKPDGVRMAALEISRNTNGVEVLPEGYTSTFITAPHRVEPREVSTGLTVEQRAPEPLTDTTDGHHDTKIFAQGGGWATFKRDGQWWVERQLGGQRSSFNLHTSSDEVAGLRFYALQNELREVPIEQILTATFALRIGWLRDEDARAVMAGETR